MSELEDIAQKGVRAREIVARYAGMQQDHDNCHWYPEIFEELMGVFGIEYPQDRKLPPRAEFRAGCQRYEDELYGKEV